MMKSLLNLAFALMLGTMIISCGGNDADNGDGNNADGTASGETETITAKGSDTMVMLAQKWAEVYHSENPNITVSVTGGGSGTGISALINGTTQIANASRPMKDEEKAQMKEKNGVDPYEIAVAKDGITIYLNPENKVEQLTIAQLKGIYEGSITNWKEVGGDDMPIVLYGRESSSGTYDFFKEHVLEKGDFYQNTQSLPGTAAVVNAVAKDKGGIGYGGAAYSQGVKVTKLVGADGTALEPSVENVVSGKYPLSRDLYFYLAEPPIGATKAFIDWVLSDEGQKLTREMEYFPIRAAAGDGAAGEGAATTDSGTAVKDTSVH